MSLNHPFGWDLPPGCTNADIDRAMGGDCDECPRCEGDGTILDDGAPDAVPIKCPRCNGEGYIDLAREKAERRLAAEEARADANEDR